MTNEVANPTPKPDPPPRQPPRPLTVLRTLLHLRPRQIMYQLYYRFWRRLDRPARHYSLPPEALAGSGNEPAADQNFSPRFTFLNRSESWPGPAAIDWNYAAYGKLWTYHLNYFAELRDGSLSVAKSQALIDAWIDAEARIQDGWEPYPTSLRIVNWLSFYRERANGRIPERVRASLYRQYRDLWTKIEYHLLGNHLLENAIALSMGAAYFRDEQRLRRATTLLRDQLAEQYRLDGSHYEDSPMYHCILLGRLLDLYAFNSKLATSSVNLPASIESQLGWLDYLLDERGQYPYLNDATPGVAPDPADLRERAGQLGLHPRPLSADARPALRHWRGEGADIWLDLGSPNPAYQAGHAHADNLTFCLSLAGSPIIVDPGVSTYEIGPIRNRERGTAYHNTVRVNDRDSSEIWAAFRLGRRASTTVLFDQDHHLVAQHDGYRQLRRIVQRSFILGQNQLNISDTCGCPAVARFHFAPGLEPQRIATDRLRVDQLDLSWNGRISEVKLEDYECATGFNQRQTARRLVLSFVDELSTQLKWELRSSD